MEAFLREELVPLSLDQRIDRMHQRDRAGAIAFVAALWVAVALVLFSVWPAITDQAILATLLISLSLVLVFNTVAILAMLRHYRVDKHFIYGMDIKHLDEMRSRAR